MVKIHKSLTAEVIIDAVERQNEGLDNPGFCIYCGEEDFESDPDTRKKECENCEKPGVYGAMELLLTY